jgi:RNA polymerase sigma factor (sigma-70 family)
MARVESSVALHHLHTLLHAGTLGCLTDRQLLERFVRADVKTAEHAFAALVARHGPMVLGVCLRILKDPHDAADAFQTTFLVLVRKATTLRVDDSLGRWLHGVSRRIALQARKAAARRSARQVSAVKALQSAVHDPERAELMAVLDDEIVRLPARLQTAVVLCDLEGLTQEAAARQLGCPVGTVASRLSRGRERLRIGLSRRGFDSSSLVHGPALRGHLAFGSVPPKLANATVRAAIQLSVEGATANLILASIHSLTASVIDAVVVARIPLALLAVPLFALGAMTATIGSATTARATIESHAPANPISARRRSQAPELSLVGRTAYDPNAFAKIRPRFDAIAKKLHVSLGQKVKKGDPLVDLFSTDLLAAKSNYQTSYVQWQNDLRLVQLRANLFEKNAIAEQLLVDARRDESKSRLAFTTCKERLLIFGVSDEQIDYLMKNLGNFPKQQQDNNATEKGKLTLQAPIDGDVIQRDVVPGNLYDRNDVLMTIAPLDHFLVWVNVPKTDAPLVKEDQACDVFVPFLDQAVATKVDWISKQAIRDRPGSVLVRMTIPNPEGRLKANMSVRVRIRPVSPTGQTPDNG